MYGNNKQEHYERMGQRAKIFTGRTGKSKVDFGNNMWDEHLLFYTEQGFTEKEAVILIHLPDRVRDFFGLKVTIELYDLYKKGNYDVFFKSIIDFVKNSNKEYILEDMEFVTEQLACGLKDIEKPSVKDKLDSLLKLDFVTKVIDKINITVNKNDIQSKEKIISKLMNFSALFFMDQKKVSGEDLSILLSDNI